MSLGSVSPALEVHPATEGSPSRRCPDLSRLRALTGLAPAVALREGLRRTFDWYDATWDR
jgi:UDP-glucuronate decarboxylase